MDYQTPAPYATAIEFTPTKAKRSYKNDNRVARADIRRDVRTLRRTANFMLDMIRTCNITTLDLAAGFRDTPIAFQPAGICSVMNYAIHGTLNMEGSMIGYQLCKMFMSREEYIDGLGENNRVTEARRKVLERIAACSTEDIVAAHKRVPNLSISCFGILA